MAMVWTSDLDTGIDVIDRQHQRIVDYINQLEDPTTRVDPQAISRVLEDLADYTLSHFAFEESLQEEVGYQYAKPHKAVHDMFIKRLTTYQHRHAAGDIIVDQLHTMLCTWLTHHIKRDDMAYVTEVGVKARQVTEDHKEGGWFSRAMKVFRKR